MMGVSHAAEGFAGGLASLHWCPHPDPVHQAAWLATWTGASLLPDLDTGRSMASRMWGPVSAGITRALARLFGGHRHLTHDLVLFPLLVWLLGSWAAAHHWGRLALVAVVIGLASRALLVRHSSSLAWMATLVGSAVGAWWVVDRDLDLGAGLVTALVGGVLVHLAGDAVTVQRLPMPIAWIFGSRQKLGLPLFRAGRRFELLVVTPANLVLIAWLAQWQLGGVDVLVHRLLP